MVLRWGNGTRVAEVAEEDGQDRRRRNNGVQIDIKRKKERKSSNEIHYSVGPNSSYSCNTPHFSSSSSSPSPSPSPSNAAEILVGFGKAWKQIKEIEKIGRIGEIRRKQNLNSGRSRVTWSREGDGKG